DSKRRVKITEPDTKPSASPFPPPTNANAAAPPSTKASAPPPDQEDPPATLLPSGITSLAPTVSTPVPTEPIHLEQAVNEAADAVVRATTTPSPPEEGEREESLTNAVVSIPVPVVSRTVTERKTQEAGFDDEDGFGGDGEQVEPVAT
ncbi:hypothetical protein HDU67_004291, partial [Dinochytrium kinnereticum]